MAATKTRRGKRVRSKAKPETPWNVILHNGWENSMPWVMPVPEKVIPAETLKGTAKFTWEPHSEGRAVAKSCHGGLAEL